MKGQVVDATTKTPVVHASVSLEITASGASKPDTKRTTGVDGSFTADVIPPAMLTVHATKRGYLSDSPGTPWFGSTVRTVAIASCDDQPALTIPICPLSTISGTVSSQTGENGRLTVELLKRKWNHDTIGLALAGMATTDNQGRYTINDVEPGRYYVRADSPETRTYGSAGAEASDPARVNDIWTFYGDSTAIQDAPVIAIAPGQSREGINLTMQTGRLSSIRGQVTGFEQPQLLSVQLNRPGIGAQLFTAGRHLEADGSFEISNVQPGPYNVVIDGRDVFSITPIDVNGADVPRLQISPAPLSHIRGRVTVQGGQLNSLRGGKISLSNEEAATGADAKIQTDGSFDVSGVRPMLRYQVSLNLPSASDFYVKGMTIGGAPIANEIDGATTAPLEVVVNLSPAHIEGFVTSKAEDGTAQPQAGLAVVVFEAPGGSAPREYLRAPRFGVADWTGHF